MLFCDCIVSMSLVTCQNGLLSSRFSRLFDVVGSSFTLAANLFIPLAKSPQANIRWIACGGFGA
jgi:hypothetical protein